jgi:hypothetical protein
LDFHVPGVKLNGEPRGRNKTDCDASIAPGFQDFPKAHTHGATRRPTTARPTLRVQRMANLGANQWRTTQIWPRKIKNFSPQTGDEKLKRGP